MAEAPATGKINDVKETRRQARLRLSMTEERAIKEKVLEAAQEICRSEIRNFAECEHG